jgi:mannose-6-phosphate isomerase-like protein (cupin superfamily)
MLIEKVNLHGAVNCLSELFQYQMVGNLNDHMLNVLQAENRTLDFHRHKDSDEMFFVIEGHFEIELENEIIKLGTGDFIIIPKGALHRPICTERVKVLLIEKKGTLNEENTGGKFPSND